MARRSQQMASLGSFLIELVIYAVFVLAYFFLVLNFLGHWVKLLSDQHRTLYAGVALALIVVQGIGLEMLTTALLKLIRRGEK